MRRRKMYRRVRVLLSLCALLAIAVYALAACAAPAAPTTAAPAATNAPAGGTVHVSIVNKDMTKDEIAKAIQAEGSVTVANWTYTANQDLVNQFQKYVKDTYGVDVKLNYEGSQSPS